MSVITDLDMTPEQAFEMGMTCMGLTINSSGAIKPPFHFGDLGNGITGYFGIYAFGFLPSLIEIQFLSFSKYV